MMLKKYSKNNHKSHNHNEQMNMHHHDHGQVNMNWKFWTKTIILVSFFLIFVVVNIVQPDNDAKYMWHYGIWFPLTSYIVFWEGRSYFKIYKNILKGIVNMDTLIGLASHILYIFSIGMALSHWNDSMFSYPQMWEGTAVLIIVTNIGHALEAKIQNSSLSAYKKLSALKNSEALLLKGNKVIKVQVSELKVGDVIIVKKGEIVTVDGTTSADGVFDYSNITGESKTIYVKKGLEVISGAYNLGSSIKITITKKSSESTLSLIIDKIEDVSMARPKLQKLADKILEFFIPSVLLISLITAITWIILGYFANIHLSWLPSSEEEPWIAGLTAGIGVLAIACPCALGIATPLVYAVSSLISAESGILINDPKALEELERVKYFAFDKTGTITSNIFDIEKIEGDQKYLGIAKALEKEVKHPIAATIMSLDSKLAKVTEIKEIINGISGIWQQKKVEIKTHESKGYTTNVALYLNGEVKLIFKLKNKIKEHVVETIKKVKDAQIIPVMITGDHKEVALEIARQVGIDKIYYEVKPNHKAKIIQELQSDGKVAFVGDGFNDSIAMKQANVSLAFASGSDITNSLSDISILRSDFYSVMNVITLARMNNNRVKIALTYAFAFNAICIPIAIILLVQPWMGAMIMASSDILVAANAWLYKRSARKKVNKRKDLSSTKVIN